MQPLNYLARNFFRTQDAQTFLKLELRHGPYLERLSLHNKLALKAVLCRYIYMKSIIDEYLILDAITETLPDPRENRYAFLFELTELSERGAEVLVEIAMNQQVDRNITD